MLDINSGKYERACEICCDTTIVYPLTLRLQKKISRYVVGASVHDYRCYFSLFAFVRIPLLKL